MDNNNQREIAEIVEASLKEFRESMEYREKLSIRIGSRTTQIIRFGMTGLSILGLALFYLIFILTKDFSSITVHMTAMSGYMKNMETNFTVVAETIGDVQKTLVVLNENITVMPTLSGSVGNMDTNMASLSTDLHTLVGQIDHMNNNVNKMANSMQVLNNQFSDMNMIVNNMAANVNQMSKPMKVFPF